MKPKAPGTAAPYTAPEHRSFHLGRSPDRVLLLHGFPGTPWEVRALGEELALLGWEVHAPLLPGFGPNIDSLGERRWNEWDETALRAFEELALGAGRMVLAGFSMGSALAVRVATRAEPRDLILINPFSGVGLPINPLLPLAERVLPDYRPFWRADFDDPWTREIVRRILPDLDVSDLTARERLRREVRIPTQALGQAQRLGSSAWQLAPAVRTPSLVVQGTEDRVTPPRRTRRFVQRLGGEPTLREVKGGHTLIWPGRAGHEEMIGQVRDRLGRAAPRRTS